MPTGTQQTLRFRSQFEAQTITKNSADYENSALYRNIHR